MVFAIPVSRRRIASVRIEEAIRLGNQSELQDDSSFLVLLTVFVCEFVHPAEFRFTVLAHHISDHVPSSQHHSVLHAAVRQVDHLLEQISTSWNKGKAI